MLDCALYLYPSEEDAESGAHAGGSGFLVEATQLVEPNLCISNFYAVTNRHVIEGGAFTVRLNTKDGNAHTVSLEEEDWRCDSNHDIAVCPLRLLPDSHKFRCVDAASMFVSKADLGPLIGIGDDVLLVG